MKLPSDFDWQGPAATILAGVAGIGVAWGAMTSDTQQALDATLRMETKIDGMSTKFDTKLDRVNTRVDAIYEGWFQGEQRRAQIEFLEDNGYIQEPKLRGYTDDQDPPGE